MIEKETGIKIIDLSDLLLDTKYFFDYLHPNKEGAKLISSEIAQQLDSLSLNISYSFRLSESPAISDMGAN
jgi:lysophospholipase L1-like esterase